MGEKKKIIVFLSAGERDGGTGNLGRSKGTAKPIGLGFARLCAREAPRPRGIFDGRSPEASVQIDAARRFRTDPAPDVTRLVAVQRPFAQGPFGRIARITSTTDNLKQICRKRQSRVYCTRLWFFSTRKRSPTNL